jgi:hypothetical protein
MRTETGVYAGNKSIKLFGSLPKVRIADAADGCQVQLLTAGAHNKGYTGNHKA